MCSISLNKTADEGLAALDDAGQRERFERKLFHLAQEANKDTKGALDNVAPMKRLPSELRRTRRFKSGRTRVYFTGQHCDCEYRVFYVKTMKKAGTDDEDHRRFQQRLIRALTDPAQSRTLNP